MLRGLRRSLGWVRAFRPDDAGRFVQVFSHPRSGTHFAEAFLARNFYPDADLHVPRVEWGHWAGRQIREEGNPFGRLFGTHLLPEPAFRRIDYPVLYIWRDGRAVAWSLWRTKGFLHPDRREMGFGDFLRQRLDWEGSPGYRARPRWTLAEHWERHVVGWMALARRNPNIVVVRYEDLKSDPVAVYRRLREAFFPERPPLDDDAVDPVERPVGIAPRDREAPTWQEGFSDGDERYFRSCLKTMTLP